MVTISSDDGASVAEPEIIFRGVQFIEEADSLVEEMRGTVADALERAAGNGRREITLIEEDLHEDVASFVYKRLRRRPMILPVVVEVYASSITALAGTHTQGRHSPSSNGAPGSCR